MKKTRLITISAIVAFILAQMVMIIITSVNLNSKIALTHEKASKTNLSYIKEEIANFDKLSDVNLRKLEIYDFSNVMFVSNDGYIEDTKYDLAEKNIFSLWSISKEDFLNKEYVAGTIIILNAEYTILGMDISFKNDPAIKKIFVYQPLSYAKKLISSSIWVYVAVAVIQFILSGALVVLLTFYYVQKSDEFGHIRQTATGYYVFVIDKNGSIISSSDGFENQFSLVNISHNVIDIPYSLSKALSNCLPISLLLETKEGETIYLKCILGRVLRGYKVVAIDDTENYIKKYKLNKSVYVDSKTGLDNEKALAVDLDHHFTADAAYSIALAVFEMKNYENISILFGAEKAKEIILNCVDIFKQQFTENIYFAEQKKFIIMANGVEFTELKLKLIRFMEIINSPMKLENNLIQLHTYASFITFSNRDSEINLNEVLSYAEYMLTENEYKKDNSRIVSQNFTKSKYNLSIGAKKAIVKTIIEDKGIKLFFQPQIELKSGKIVSFESLVRLNKEEVIDMTVQEFIMISELNGYMIPLGDIIFEKAFTFAKRIEGSNVCIGINISPIQLMQVGFVESFLKKYNEFNLKPNSISIEITETFLMRNIDENISKLKILQDNAITVHLDDFGKGYSSLTYLKKLPINAIKIDRDFVIDITENKYSKAISKIVIDTCKDLNLISIAEGVETIKQNDCLKALGCDVIQGYLYGKAVSEDEAYQLVMKEEFKI